MSQTSNTFSAMQSHPFVPKQKNPNAIIFQEGEGFLKTLRLGKQCYAMNFFTSLPLAGIDERLPRHPLRLGPPLQYTKRENDSIVNRYQRRFEKGTTGVSTLAAFTENEKSQASKAQSVSYYSLAHDTTFFGCEKKSDLIGVKDLGSLPFQRAWIKDIGTLQRPFDSKTKAEAILHQIQAGYYYHDYQQWDEYKQLIKNNPQFYSEILAKTYWDFSRSSICVFKDTFSSRCAAYGFSIVFKNRLLTIAKTLQDNDPLKTFLLNYEIPISYHYMQNNTLHSGIISQEQISSDKAEANRLFRDSTERNHLIFQGKSEFLGIVDPAFLEKEFFFTEEYKALLEDKLFIAEILLLKYNLTTEEPINIAKITQPKLTYCSQTFIVALAKTPLRRSTPVEIFSIRSMDLSNIDLRALNLSNKKFSDVSFRNSKLPTSILNKTEFDHCDFRGADFDFHAISANNNGSTFSFYNYNKITMGQLLILLDIGHRCAEFDLTYITNELHNLSDAKLLKIMCAYNKIYYGKALLKSLYDRTAILEVEGVISNFILEAFSSEDEEFITLILRLAANYRITLTEKILASIACISNTVILETIYNFLENKVPDLHDSLSLLYAKASEHGNLFLINKLMPTIRYTSTTCSQIEMEPDLNKLFVHAVINNQYKVADIFIKKGVDPLKVFTLEDNHVLHWAARHGYTNLLNKFIKYKALIDRQNSSGYTPLMYACYFGYLSIVKKLHSEGANFKLKNKEGDFSFILAIDQRNFEIAHYILDKGLVNINAIVEKCNHTEYKKTNLLQYLVVKNLSVFVKRFIELGADIDYKNSSGNTALRLAIQFKALDALQVLLSHNAKIGIENNMKQNVLQYKMETHCIYYICTKQTPKNLIDFAIKAVGRFPLIIATSLVDPYDPKEFYAVNYDKNNLLQVKKISNNEKYLYRALHDNNIFDIYDYDEFHKFENALNDVLQHLAIHNMHSVDHKPALEILSKSFTAIAEKYKKISREKFKCVRDDFCEAYVKLMKMALEKFSVEEYETVIKMAVRLIDFNKETHDHFHRNDRGFFKSHTHFKDRFLNQLDTIEIAIGDPMRKAIEDAAKEFTTPNPLNRTIELF